MAVYSSGDWHVKPGKEQEFIDTWKQFASWSASEFGGGTGMQGIGAKLLRDKEDPSFFRSVGEWPDERMLEEWRSSDGFKQRSEKLREMVDDFHIRAMEVAAEIRAETYVGVAK